MSSPSVLTELIHYPKGDVLKGIAEGQIEDG